LKGRLAFLAVGLSFVSLPIHAGAAPQLAEVFKTSGCGCCLEWEDHLKANGFSVVSRNLAMGDLMKMKLDAGLKPGQTSCHSARIDGYFIEGHVPAKEIARLQKERPNAIGLVVPNMPQGSPGMPGDAEAYDVLLVGRDGTTTVYASYAAKSK